MQDHMVPTGIEPIASAVEAQTPWPLAFQGLSQDCCCYFLSKACAGRRACGLHCPGTAVDARIWHLKDTHPGRALPYWLALLQHGPEMEALLGFPVAPGGLRGITLNAKPLHEPHLVIRLCWDTANDASRTLEPQESSPSPSALWGRWGEGVVFPSCPWLGL